MKNILGFLVLLVAIIATVFSVNAFAQTVDADLKKVFSSYGLTTISSQEVLRKARAGEVITLNTGNGNLQIRLTENDVRAQGHKLVAKGAKGKQDVLARTENVTFKGTVVGDSSSIV